ncbi:DUF7868 domain-containing protein [Paraburkholderia bannensis]|uniref:DUF7868 domain-containing protein n=1 Tax=Paraburkholderia bannensis TaxID=765414 RepID=UPI002ABDC8C9|nr:hypothetical protein [Paraburkholderia bannensis]
MSDAGNTAGWSRSLRALASSKASIVVNAAGVEVPLHIDDDAAALLAGTDAAATVRLYLLLEQVRGTLDATVLQIYLRHPDPARSGQHGALFMGSIALYGLRRATSASPDRGMVCILDISAHDTVLRPAIARGDTQFELYVRPHPPLQTGTSIDIGRIGICIEPRQP